MATASPNRKKIFITGATGFLGRNLLESLIRSSEKDMFFILARSDAARRMLQEQLGWVPPQRFRIVSGDVTLPNCGLGEHTLRQVVQGPTEFWHIAAATSFDNSKREEIIRANLGGTANVISLAKQAKSLEALYYASTAYIAGTNADTILEDRMPANNGFKNIYEESKYESEKRVRESGLPFVVMRPSIILGNSRTGDSQCETRMMYGYLLGLYYSIIKNMPSEGAFIQQWRHSQQTHVHLRLLGYYHARKNFICVDDVVNMIMEIKRQRPLCKTFNLTSKCFISLADVKSAVERSLNIRGLELVGSDIADPTMTERRIMRFTKPFEPYALKSDPVWDTTNTDQALTEYKRIDMSPALFAFLMQRFVEQHIIEPYGMHEAASRSESEACALQANS